MSDRVDDADDVDEVEQLEFRIGGTLPAGTKFTAAVSTDLITLGADGRVCAAHPRWMTPAQATRLAGQLLHVATRGSR